jgi:transposase-like protein
MAASRLSDAQKDEIVAGYRQGATAVALASAFGCSPNTVSRVVKTALSPDEYAALKQQRGRGDTPPAPRSLEEPSPPVQPLELGTNLELNLQLAEPTRPVEPPAPVGPLAAEEEGGPGVLAIDDADDFAAEDGDPDGDDLDELSADDEPDEAPPALVAHEPVQCRCLSEAQLPTSAYLLVDKTVELQPVSLGDCSDLGPLPAEESVRQALQLYVNPRQAKRHCGRSQRVIQLPDPSLLQRTAPYLLAQGISRVVIEGSLYSLPGS